MVLRISAKILILVALIGASAAAFVWARPAGHAHSLGKVSLSCEIGKRRVRLQISPRRGGRLHVVLERRGGRPIARVRLARGVDQRMLGRKVSRRLLSYTRARGSCGESRTSRRVVAHLRSGKHRRSQRVRLRARTCTDCEAGGEPSQPGNSSSPATPASAGSSCSALVNREPPQVVAPGLNEASGLAFSRSHEGLIWTHNDSGGGAELFALDIDGKLVGRWQLDGASNTDWEDIATGPGPDPTKSYIYAGDIGDNAGARASIDVYRVAEPAQRPAGDGTFTDVERQTLTYPDGARDAETLLVDPSDSAIYVISKREAQSRVYRFAGPWSGGVEQLDYLGQLDWGGAVAGDVSPSGRTVALKSYLAVRTYERASGQSIWQALSGEAPSAPYVPEPQGEALGLCDDNVYLTLSEGVGQPLYAYSR